MIRSCKYLGLKRYSAPDTNFRHQFHAEGSAVVESDRLRLTVLPLRAKFPVKIAVVA